MATSGNTVSKFEEVRALRISSTSKSGAIIAAFNGFGGLKVQINEKKVRAHNEYSLAEETEDAIQSATQAFRDAQIEIADRFDNANEPMHDVHHFPAWADEISARLGDLEAIGRSIHKHVEITTVGFDEFFVQYFNNCVRRTDITAVMLETEINSAIKDMRRVSVQNMRRIVLDLKRQGYK